MEAKVMVGLDVGSSKIAVAVGRLDSQGKLLLMGFSQINNTNAVSQGVVRYITQAAEAIKVATKVAGEVSDVGIGTVNTNITDKNLEFTLEKGSIRIDTNVRDIINLNDIEKLMADMRQVRMPLGSKLLHAVPQEFEVDDNIGGKVFNPTGMPGTKLEAEFMMLRSPEANFNNLANAIKQTGIEVEQYVYSGLASAIATVSAEEMKAGVALIDIGAATTDLVIYHKNMVKYAATLPIGGQLLTQDIEQAFGILTETAENLKTKFGMAIAAKASDKEFILVPGIGSRGEKEVSAKNLAIVCEERSKEILALVWSHIIKAGYSSKLGSGLVFTGGAAALPFFDELASKSLKIDARICRPTLNIANSPMPEQAYDPAFATAIGLLWKGFKSYDERETQIQLEKDKKEEETKAKVAQGFLPFDQPQNKNYWKKLKDFLKGNSQEFDDKI